MRHRWLPKERPEHFEINSDCWLARGLVFAGLGGLGCHHSSRFADSSWYGNHGTLTNMDPATDWVWVPELGRWALDFDGNNDYVAVGDLPSMRFSTAFTLATILHHTDTYVVTTVRGLFNKYTASGSLRSYTLFVYHFGGQIKPYAYVSGNGTTGEAVDSLYALPVGRSHVALRWVAGVWDWFVNGQIIKSGTTTATSLYNTTTPFSVGVDYNSRPMLGWMADPMGWNWGLSNSQISRLADPSNVMLESGGVPLIQHRRTWWPVAVAGNRRRRFFLGAA